MHKTWVLSLVGEDLLEEGMATHSSTLAEKITDGEAWGPQSIGSERVLKGRNTPILFNCVS